MRKFSFALLAIALCLVVTHTHVCIAQNQPSTDNPAVTATAESSATLDLTPILDNLLDNGMYDSVVSLAQAGLADDPGRLELLHWEVRAAFLGEKPDEYVSSVLSSTSTELAGQLRRALVLYYQGRHKEAIKELQSLERKYPGYCQVLFWSGRVADAMGMDSAAEAYFLAAAASPDCYAEAYKSLSYMERAIGKLDKSDASLNLVAAIPKHASYALYGKAWNTGYRGYWQKAITMLLDSKDTLREPDFYRNLSRIYSNAGRYNDAIRVLEEARGIWPKNKYLLDGLSWVYGRVGLDKAALEAIAAFHPLNMQYLGSSARVSAALNLKDTLAIEQECRTLLTDHYDFTYPARVYIDWLDTRQRQQEADSIVQRFAQSSSLPVEAEVRASRIDQDTPVEALGIIDSLLPGWQRQDYLQRRRIELMYESGQIERAEAAVEEFLRMKPGDMNFLDDLVGIHYHRNNREEALKWIDRIEKYSPDSYEAAEWRLRILLDERKWDQAEELLTKVSAEYPHYYYLLYLYTELYSGDEHKEQLREVVMQYLARGAQSTDYLCQLERALTDVGEFDVADSLMTAAIEQNPNSAELYYRRGWVNNAANRFVAAQEDFERALELDPHCDYIRNAVLGANFETVTLNSITGKLAADTTALRRLSVDSVLALSRKCDLKPGLLGGVVLLDKAQRIVFSKYRSLRRYHYIAKLVKAQAKDSYGTMELGFNAYNEQPHVLAARTIFADGRTAEVKPEQIYITSSGSSSNDWRDISFSFPAVDTGTIVEYVVQFEEGYDDPEELYWSLYASAYDPVMISQSDIYVPASWPIVYEQTPGMNMSRADSAGFTIYRGQAQQLKAVVWESNAPSTWEQGEWFRLGYGQTWREVADTYWRKIQRKIESSDYITELAGRITSGLSTEEEKIDALFRFVADSIRYVAIEFGEGSTVPRPATQVIENRYGDCKDQTVLLVSLLKAIGVDAYPMLATSYDTSSFSRAVPNDMQFSHVVTYLPTDPPRYMDPTCQHCATYGLTIAYKGKPGLLIGTDLENPLITTPPETADDNTFHRKVRMMPQPAGGVVLDVDITFDGSTGLWLKQNYEDADSTKNRQLAEGDSPVGLWAACKLKDYEIRDFSQPGKKFSWTARLAADSLFMKRYTYAEANIWLYTISLMMTVPDTVGRTLDAELSSLFRVKDEFMIIPGDNWELDNYRLGWTMDTTWFRAQSGVTEWDDSVLVSVTFELKQTRIPVEELPLFVKAVRLVQRRVEQQTPYYRKRADANRMVALKKALEASPNDISLLVSLADLYLGEDNGGYSCIGKQNRARARECMRKALEINIKNEALIYRMGLLLMEDDLYRDADSLFRAYRDSSGGAVSPYVQLLLAGTSAEVGDYEQSLKLMEDYMAMAPTEQLRIQLVRLYAFLGKVDEAQKQIELMETLSSDSTMMMAAKFRFYYETGQVENAQEIVNQWPDTSRLVRSELNSLLHHETENWEEGLKETDELLADSPDNPGYLNNAAWYRALMEIELDLALELVNRSIGLTGGCNESSLNTRALVYMKMGEWEKAKEDLDVALQSQSAGSTTVNYYFLGECALVDKDKEKAKEYFTRAVDVAGNRWALAKAKKRLEELN